MERDRAGNDETREIALRHVDERLARDVGFHALEIFDLGSAEHCIQFGWMKLRWTMRPLVEPLMSSLLRSLLCRRPPQRST